jgi:hypothetical protein
VVWGDVQWFLMGPGSSGECDSFKIKRLTPAENSENSPRLFVNSILVWGFVGIYSTARWFSERWTSPVAAFQFAAGHEVRVPINSHLADTLFEAREEFVADSCNFDGALHSYILIYAPTSRREIGFVAENRRIKLPKDDR